jgi:hypothetical protein
MKALLILFYALIAALNGCSQSPNTNEWIRQKKTQRAYLLQQIAALEVYYNYLKKGYQIADKGLTLIGDIKDGAFQNDKVYIESLRNVSPVVRDSPRLVAVITYRNTVLGSLSRLLSDCRGSEFYSLQEIRYMETIYENMKRQCAITINELELLSSSETEMKDDERINRLDKIYAVMQERDGFARSFCNDARLIGRERAKIRHEIEISTKLNDL